MAAGIPIFLSLLALLAQARGEPSDNTYREHTLSETSLSYSKFDPTSSFSDRPPFKSSWPCPEPDDIDPCVCIRDGDYIDMDCSEVQGDDQLAGAFQAHFHFYTFRQLRIFKDEAESRVPITILNATTFNNASFAMIEIAHTSLVDITVEAFANSFPFLTSISVSDNDLLTTFPFDVLAECPLLEELTLDKNSIHRMSDIIAPSLTRLTITHNPGILFGEEVFYGAPNMERMVMSNLQLFYLPDRLFSQQTSLTYLDLRNNIVQKLYNGSMFFSGPIDQINLNNNDINHIQAGAFGGLNPGTVLLLQDNEISDLPQRVWEPIFQAVMGPDEQIILLKGNPLTCECNLLWVVENPVYLNLLAANVECDTGLFLYDVIEIIINNC